MSNQFGVCDVNSWNSFFDEIGSLLTIRIPHRFYNMSRYSQHEMDKNLQAVLKGIKKRLNLEGEVDMRQLSAQQISIKALQTMETAGDYINSLANHAVQLEALGQSLQKEKKALLELLDKAIIDGRITDSTLTKELEAYGIIQETSKSITGTKPAGSTTGTVDERTPADKTLDQEAGSLSPPCET